MWHKCLPPSLGSIWLRVREQIWFSNFQDGHLGYRNGTIIAILNLYFAPMLTIKFRLNPTYGLGGDVVWKISRWLPWRFSFLFFFFFFFFFFFCFWISERNDFSNSESLCRSDAPIKFRLNLTYGLGDVVWRFLRWPPWLPSWISEWNVFSNSESPCHCDASHQVSQSDLRFGRRCRLKNFKMAAILDIGTERF